MRARIVIRSALALFVVAALTAVAIGWRLHWIAVGRSGKTSKSVTSNYNGIRNYLNGESVSIDAFPGSMEKRAFSVDDAARQTGLPTIKVPSSLFGKKAQVFNNPVRVTIYYSNETTPTITDGLISMVRLDPRLASPQQMAEQGRKYGAPYQLRDHKGYPGYALEKGENTFRNGKTAPRPAVIEWLKDGVTYTVKGPPGVGLNELIPIADSID